MSSSSNWIIVDVDGSWHGFDTTYAVKLTDEQIEDIHADHGGEIDEYLGEHAGEYSEGTVVIWEDVRDSIMLAMSSEHIPSSVIDSVMATALDAIVNNVYR